MVSKKAWHMMDEPIDRAGKGVTRCAIIWLKRFLILLFAVFAAALVTRFHDTQRDLRPTNWRTYVSVTRIQC